MKPVHNQPQQDPQPVSASAPSADLCETQLAELTAKAEEWKNKYLRALADYQNLERRVREDRLSDRQYATEAVLAKLIPIVDSLVLAQGHLKDAGLELVIKDVRVLLDGFGAKRMVVVGKPFDPGTMECIEVVEGKNGIVVEEVASGYTMGNTLIRAAKVKVGQEGKKEA